MGFAWTRPLANNLSRSFLIYLFGTYCVTIFEVRDTIGPMAGAASVAGVLLVMTGQRSAHPWYLLSGAGHACRWRRSAKCPGLGPVAEVNYGYRLMCIVPVRLTARAKAVQRGKCLPRAHFRYLEGEAVVTLHILATKVLKVTRAGCTLLAEEIQLHECSVGCTEGRDHSLASDRPSVTIGGSQCRCRSIPKRKGQLSWLIRTRLETCSQTN